MMTITSRRLHPTPQDRAADIGSAVTPAPTFRPGRGCRQRGAGTVEFALIAMFAFIPLLLGVVELGRLFYVVTTTQEITRRAARQQVVQWLDQRSTVQRQAVFREAGAGSVSLPGGPEVHSADVRLDFYPSYLDALNGTKAITSGSPQSNVTNCITNTVTCIRYVRASLESAAGAPVPYQPVAGWFDAILNVPLPGATVIMPAEALGLL